MHWTICTAHWHTSWGGDRIWNSKCSMRARRWRWRARNWSAPRQASGGRAQWGERDELTAHWERASGRRAPDLRYWTALSAYKLSIMLEGVFRRSAADPTRGDASGLGDTAVSIMREAQQTIHG